MAVVEWIAHAKSSLPGANPTQNSAPDQGRQSKNRIKLEDKVKTKIKHKYKIWIKSLVFTEQLLAQASSRGLNKNPKQISLFPLFMQPFFSMTPFHV
jgi:hypothetical protein